MKTTSVHCGEAAIGSVDHSTFETTTGFCETTPTRTRADIHGRKVTATTLGGSALYLVDKGPVGMDTLIGTNRLRSPVFDYAAEGNETRHIPNHRDQDVARKPLSAGREFDLLECKALGGPVELLKHCLGVSDPEHAEPHCRPVADGHKSIAGRGK